MDLQSLYNQAQAAQKAGQLAQAEQAYRQILAQAPVPEVMVNLGNVLAAQNRREEALANFDKALAARPDLFEALYNRANLLLELKRPEDALQNYDRVVGLAPGVCQRLEQSRHRAAQPAKTGGSAGQLLARRTLSPTHGNAATNVAIVLWDLGRLEEALAAADRALKIAPNSADALYIKANVLRDMKRPDEALAHFEQTLTANPAHQHALTGAAQMALSLCDWERVDALRPRVTDNAASGPAVIQPFVLLGYSDDAATSDAAAPRIMSAAPCLRVPHFQVRAARTTASGWPICRPIFTSIPPPSCWRNCSSAMTGHASRSPASVSAPMMAAPCARA